LIDRPCATAPSSMPVACDIFADGVADICHLPE
jgi:hypothetical protein